MIDADHKASPLIGVPLKRSRSRSAEAESAGFIRLAESNLKRNLKEERETEKKRVKSIFETIKETRSGKRGPAS